MSESTQPRRISAELLKHLNFATFEALRLMRKPESETTPNGCPILSDGPQRDDL